MRTQWDILVKVRVLRGHQRNNMFKGAFELQFFHMTSGEARGWNLCFSTPHPTRQALSSFPRASRQSKQFVFKYIKLHNIFPDSPKEYQLISLCSFLSEPSGP